MSLKLFSTNDLEKKQQHPTCMSEYDHFVGLREKHTHTHTPVFTMLPPTSDSFAHHPLAAYQGCGHLGERSQPLGEWNELGPPQRQVSNPRGFCWWLKWWRLHPPEKRRWQRKTNQPIWRCMSYWKWEIFTCHVSFQGCSLCFFWGWWFWFTDSTMENHHSTTCSDKRPENCGGNFLCLFFVGDFFYGFYHGDSSPLDHHPFGEDLFMFFQPPNRQV